MVYSAIVAQYEKILREQYSLTTSINHRGERGRQREDNLRRFLVDHLPEAYGVATGEILPYKGTEISPQCDLIIYDRLRMPIFGKNDAVQQVPFEAVYAVIEVKSVLNTSALADMRKKMDFIRNMPRCSTPTNEYGPVRLPYFKLFAYTSKTTGEKCREFVDANAIGEDLEVAVLDNGLTIWLGVPPDPVVCVWLDMSDPQEDYYETLAIFFVGLLEDLRTMNLGQTSFMEMLFYNRE